ncbi:MAG: CPBP family intramembrane glutamic endopeptidase [Methylococcaceae bacterium]
MSLFRIAYNVLMPLFILIVSTAIACIIGYGLVLLTDNHLPLAKTISRITEVLLILSIFPALSILKLTKVDLGFSEKKIFSKQLIKGFTLGLSTLLPVFIVLYALGVHVIDDSKIITLAFFAKKISLALLTALIISLLEEPLFRGLIFISLKNKVSTVAAVFFSAFYYALVHFLQNKTEISANELSLLTSFQLAAGAFANLFNPSILSAFIALLMVGVFLAMIRLKIPNSLGWCIGCHTAWVLQIKLSKEFFNTDFNSDYGYLVSHYDGVIGGLVSVWLLLAMTVYWIYQRYSQAK